MLASVWEVLSDAGYVLDVSREAAAWCVQDGIRETEGVVNGDEDGDGQSAMERRMTWLASQWTVTC